VGGIMIIEFANADDIEVISRIEGECFCDKAWSLEMIESDFLNRSIYVVAREGVDDNVIAYLSMLDLDVEGEVLRLAVRKQYRRRGIARKLMIYLIDYLKEKYYQKLFLEVDNSNLPAIKLYESLGFEKFSERKNYYGVGKDAFNYILLL